MKILIVLPSQWMWHRPYLSSPYLSLPSLFAYIKANRNDELKQIDLNLEAYEQILSKNYLLGLKERLEERFMILDSKDKLNPGPEQAYYHDLFMAKNCLDDVAERIESAKTIFKTKDFYSVEFLSTARKTLDQALSIVSAAYFPINSSHMWFTSPPFQGSFEELREITQSRLENPFIDLYGSSFIPAIEEQAPDLICISVVNHSQLIPALTLSRLIKSSNCKAHITVGGGVITLLADGIMNHGELFDIFFDSAVLNEGERPLLNLVEKLSCGESLTNVPNLIYRESGSVQRNEVLPAEDINSLPTPCFDGLHLKSYLSPEIILPILSSRGCYWGKCAFCGNCETYSWKYKKRDEHKVADDLQELSSKYGATHFAFSDECLSPSAFEKLSDEILSRNMNVKSWAQARLEPQFNPDLCDKMSKAGFKLLLLGLESGCNRVLEHMKKGTTKETAASVCKNLYEAGIWNHLYAFFGFPTETRAEAQETIDFLFNNRNIIHSFNIDAFIVASGSSIKKQPEIFGIDNVTKGEHSDLDLTFDYNVSSGLTHEEADKLSKICEDKVGNAYESAYIMSKLAQDDILLYMSYYEKQDPLLRLIVDKGHSNIEPPIEITPDSVLRISRHTTLNKLRFNLIRIGQDLINGPHETIFPEISRVIFNPRNGKSAQVDPQLAEIIGFCNGKNNIKQISFQLSKRYDAPPQIISRDCMELLQPLVKQGFLSVAR